MTMSITLTGAPVSLHAVSIYNLSSFTNNLYVFMAVREVSKQTASTKSHLLPATTTEFRHMRVPLLPEGDGSP